MLCSFEGPWRARSLRFWRRASANPRGLAKFPVVIARGKHLFPFRTEPLSLSAPMVLGPQGPGRVGRRRFFLIAPVATRRLGLFAFLGLASLPPVCLTVVRIAACRTVLMPAPAPASLAVPGPCDLEPRCVPAVTSGTPTLSPSSRELPTHVCAAPAGAASMWLSEGTRLAARRGRAEPIGHRRRGTDDSSPCGGCGCSRALAAVATRARTAVSTRALWRRDGLAVWRAPAPSKCMVAAGSCCRRKEQSPA